jgi:ubiquinone/menaquinone biosynthesis C-methylase UbiE
MAYAEQDTFFARAYRTGTDAWTRIPYNRKPLELALFLPKGSMILDIGAGRGHLLYDYAKLGFRAIGLENNPELVKKGNAEIKAHDLEKDLRFMEGTALDIPLSDASFDAVSDIGLLQHIASEDQTQYVSEVARVLKPGGIAYIIVLSKHTPSYLSWKPSANELSDYIQEGVQYHFFSDEELRRMFEPKFEVSVLDRDAPFGPTNATFAVCILKKK